MRRLQALGCANSRPRFAVRVAQPLNKLAYADGVTDGTPGATGGQQGFAQQTLTQTAVPEPASLTLVGLGAVGLGGYALRRRKAAKG
jgi:hypothetical protein